MNKVRKSEIISDLKKEGYTEAQIQKALNSNIVKAYLNLNLKDRVGVLIEIMKPDQMIELVKKIYRSESFSKRVKINRLLEIGANYYNDEVQDLAEKYLEELGYY